MFYPSSALATAFLLAVAASTAPTVEAKTERELLLEFYFTLNGPSWNDNSGWEDDSKHFCHWHGVICQGDDDDDLDTFDEDTRHLLQLDDDANNKRRQLDDTITIPQALHGKVIGLKLKNNNILGRVPASFWELPNLRILHLSQNPGVEVAFTGASDTLIEVKMHGTATSSVTGIGRYPNLLSVHMSESPLGSVTFPTELLQLKQLRNLHMAHCQLQGQVPQEIYQLSELRELNFYDNELTGLIPAGIEYLANLKLLTLSHNHFKGILPEWLNGLEAMEQLYLEYNQLTGQLVSLNRAPKLTRVYLDNNALSENIPADFLDSVNDGATVRVNLDNNQLGPLVPDTLENLASVNLKMTLAGNLFSGFASDTLCDNTQWMDGLVGAYGCNAMLCPVGTSATLGRQTATSGCDGCASGEYLGQFACYDQDDRRTLQFLYAETGGDHWHRRDGWLRDDTAVCDWYGVKCYTENDPGENHLGRVKRVELPNNGLIGQISEQIYALDVLAKLDLSWNQISFPFSGLDKTTSLHILNIGHTDTTTFDGLENGHEFFSIFLADHLDISGTIPSQLYKNTNLKILSMNNCGLSGDIQTEIGNLINLKELYLWGNNLKGSIPSELASLDQLRIVTLAKNQLTGTLPDLLQELPDLRAFSVKDQISKGGGLTGNLLPFQYNDFLSTLVLSGNKFDGSIPSSLLDNVNNNKGNDDVLDTLIVDLSDNQLTGSVPGALSKFDQMDLFVQDNFLTSVDPQLCGKRDWMYGNVGEYGCDAILCPKFTASALGRQAFDAQNCGDCAGSIELPTVGQTQCGGKKAVMTEKQRLELLYSQCGGQDWIHQENWMRTGEICDWFGVACDDAKSVVSIVLGANNMGGTIPTELFMLPNLQRLSVFANTVDFSFEGIENAVNLRSLILDGTSVTSIAGVGNARGLTELNVRANKLDGTLPDELNNLNSLESLVLSDNALTGSLPLWLGNLNNLMTLMLSNNELTGELIPLDRYSGIALLGLANNQFTGTIPPTFLLNSFRDAKVFVDISGNQLTGSLPQDLARLNKLSIHLKNNRLTTIDSTLCRMEAWNDYDVQDYGCDGIMCPVGTFNDKGRRSSVDDACEECDANKYMGQTQCSSAWRVLLLSSTTTIMALVGLALCL